MQAHVFNKGSAKLVDGRMIWHLFTDMDNQFVKSFDVFPPARVIEKTERNMVAVISVPELNPQEDFSPSVVLRIDTTTRDWLMEKKATSNRLITKNREMYCKGQKFWEIDDSAVQEMSMKIAERTGSDESYLKLAYQKVRERVYQDTHLDVRLGAARAARGDEGDCDEHADLLIALLRAVKIPARRVVGHYYRGKPIPEPHAWCEVFLEKHGWIPIDPALGNYGRLDECYFSRIREGLISERPTLQLGWNGIASEPPMVEEEVKISIIKNGTR
jgi:transglutaminase-like putative cysteine protease